MIFEKNNNPVVEGLYDFREAVTVFKEMVSITLPSLVMIREMRIIM